MFFHNPDQYTPHKLVNQSCRFELNLHDCPDYKSIYELKSEPILHNVLQILLSPLHFPDRFVKFQSIVRLVSLFHYYGVEIWSCAPTSVSFKYFVMSTMTPWRLLISTLSIKALMSRSPNPPSRSSDTGCTSSTSLSGPIRFFISSNLKLSP